MASLIDWELAGRTAKRLSPTPPAIDLDTAHSAVAEMYQAVDRAAGYVADLTRLQEPTVTARTIVVDRPGGSTSTSANAQHHGADHAET